MNVSRVILEEKKVEVPNVKFDPIVCNMPGFVAKFRRFETDKSGEKLFVVYEITTKEPA